MIIALEPTHRNEKKKPSLTINVPNTRIAIISSRVLIKISFIDNHFYNKYPQSTKSLAIMGFFFFSLEIVVAFQAYPLQIWPGRLSSPLRWTIMPWKGELFKLGQIQSE